MDRAYEYSQALLSRLADNPAVQLKCKKALDYAIKGQEYLNKSKDKRALKWSFKAHHLFSEIPQALYLLATTKTDISAAYLNLNRYSECIIFARESIHIIGGVGDFRITEAMAYMNLGVALGKTGHINEAFDCLDQSESILQKPPPLIDYLTRVNVARMIVQRYRLL